MERYYGVKNENLKYRITRLYESGVPIKKISEILGISEDEVLKILNGV